MSDGGRIPVGVAADEPECRSIYKSCPVVANICLYADPDANKPMAVSIKEEVQVGFEADVSIADHFPA